MHDLSLNDNPVADPDVWEGYRPVNMQKATQLNHKDLPLFLERVRALMDEYDDQFKVQPRSGASIRQPSCAPIPRVTSD